MHEETKAARQQLAERGRVVRRELLGPAATDRLDASTYTDAPLMEKFRDFNNEVIFGVLWDRDGIDLKTRSLVTAIADVATGQTEALSLHLRFCLRHGWSVEEITECIIHLTGYVGVPLVRRALVTAEQVFAVIATEGGA